MTNKLTRRQTLAAAIGTGLGLAFTQEVIRLHGGKIAVHSELNKGTQFLITLPSG